MPNRNLRFNNLIDADSGRQVPIDELVTENQLNTAVDDEWNQDKDYYVGREVVRNNLRYIARSPSGPNNGGAVDPEDSAGIAWDLRLPYVYSTSNIQGNQWFKLAVITGTSDVNGDFLSLDVIGASTFEVTKRFSANVIISERGDAVEALISVASRGSAVSDPTFYTRRTSANVFELWLKVNAGTPCPLTLIRRSRARYNGTVAGLLEVVSSEPAGLTLVPYDKGYQFASIPIGMEVAFDTPPPIDDPRFRFVKLTADDAYNGSLLNNKVISGTTPNLVVKMTVNSALSPINGHQIFMLNTMRAIPTPGVFDGVIIQDAIRNIKGVIRPEITQSYGASIFSSNSLSGAFKAGALDNPQRPVTTPSQGGGGWVGAEFDASLVVPTAERNQPFGVARVFYKRVY